MKNTLLMSVAAIALIAGAGLASAQGNQGREAPSPGPAAQQNAPPGKMGPALKETTGQPSPESKTADEAKPGQKASGPKAEIKKDKDAPTPATKPSVGRAPVPDNKSNATTAQPPETNKSNATTGASDTGKSQGTTSQSQSTTTKTIGGGAANPSALLSTEQRGAIRIAIKQQNVRPVTNVDFSISVGARVPRTVHFYTVPVELAHLSAMARI